MNTGVTISAMLLCGVLSSLAVEVRWYGQSFFTLTGTNAVVAIDPFDGKFVNYPIPQDVKADLLLVTHEHNDHNNVRVIQGEPLTLRAERAIGRNDRDEVKVRGVSAWHDDKRGEERGRNTVFTIEMDGVRFCHLGDIGQTAFTEEQLARIGAVDVVFVPVGGHFTTDPKDVRALIDPLAPRVIVPMHYKTPYTGNLPLGRLEEFLKRNNDLPAKKLDETGFTASQGSLPAKPEIWVPAVP